MSTERKSPSALTEGPNPNTSKAKATLTSESGARSYSAGQLDVWAAMREYQRKGWHPFPLPPAAKEPPLGGFTGRARKAVTAEQVEAWATEGEHSDDSNLGLRMPEGMLGVDVDPYHGGEATMSALVAKLGALPEGPRSISGRGEGSGHHFFRVPAGREYAQVAGPGVDILQPHHRYSVAWPSVHPVSGLRYTWSDKVVPSVADLPELPEAWVLHLDAGPVGAAPERGTSDAAKAWLEALPESEPCLEMAAALTQARASLLNPPGPRHDAMRDATRRLVGLAEQGHLGLEAVLASLRDVWVEAMAGEPSERQEPEYDRAVDGAVMLAAVGGAPGDDPCTTSEAGEEGRRPRKGAATVPQKLVALALDKYSFLRDDEGSVFAVLKGGHVGVLAEAAPNTGLGAELASMYYERTGRVPGSSQLSDALRVLLGKAAKSDPVRVYRRAAKGSDGVVWVDMGDAKHRVIRITSQGWGVVDSAPHVFRRGTMTHPFVDPAGPGDLDALWSLVNVAEEDRPLLLAWLVHALIDSEGAHCVLTFTGEQGTGKTFATQACVDLTDPTNGEAQALPDNMRDLIVLLNGGWVISLDNLSGMSQKQSDVLSRAVTGAAQTFRSLYTNKELAVLRLHNVLILAGITLGKLHADLEERMLPIELHRIKSRMKEEVWKSTWADVRPRVFAGLLDLAVRVLGAMEAGVPEPPEGYPRMTSYAVVLRAVDSLLGTDGWSRFKLNERRQAQEGLEGDMFLRGIETVLGVAREPFVGSAALLLDLIEGNHAFQATEASHRVGRNAQYFPTNGKQAAAALTRGAPVLRKLGWTVEKSDRAMGRDKVFVWTIAQPAGEPAPAPVDLDEDDLL